MSYLCIENQGEVDPRAFTLLGASVKEGDDAIGMFGSGTKYTLATLLRNGLEPIIFSGLTPIVVGKAKTKFRNAEFDIITINGQETSLTTATGLKWRVNQCIRELYSNALDEGGAEAFEYKSLPSGEIGKTRVFVPWCDTIQTMWNEWHKYFLDESFFPISKGFSWEKNELYDIEATGNTPSIMRRGVWCVEDWGQHNGIFSYNFYDVNLPETRLINAYATRYSAGILLARITADKYLIMLDETKNDENSFEWLGLGYSRATPSEEFAKFFKKKYKYAATAREIMYFPDSMRPEIALCTSHAFHFLTKEVGLKDIRDYRNADNMFHEMAWPIGYADRVNAAITKLRYNNINIDFPIKYVRFPEGDDVIAKADHRSGLCLLSPKAFEDESTDLILYKALIEEWTHLQHKVLDGTAEQQHLYLKTIVGLLK